MEDEPAAQPRHPSCSMLTCTLIFIWGAGFLIIGIAIGISTTGQPESIHEVEKPVGAGKGPIFLVPQHLIGWRGEQNFNFTYKTEDVLKFISDVYMVFVNYRRLSKLAEETELDCYKEFYAKDKCQGGCIGDTQCRKGICHCNEKQIFGQCVGLTEQDTEDSLKYRKPTCFPYCLPQDCYETVELNFKSITRVKESMAGNPECQEDPSKYDSFNPGAETCSSNCSSKDINLVCDSETGKCKCRQDMMWNSETYECEMHIPVICPSSLPSGNPDIEKILSGRDVFGFSKTFNQKDIDMTFCNILEGHGLKFVKANQVEKTNNILGFLNLAGAFVFGFGILWLFLAAFSTYKSCCHMKNMALDPRYAIRVNTNQGTKLAALATIGADEVLEHRQEKEDERRAALMQGFNA